MEPGGGAEIGPFLITQYMSKPLSMHSSVVNSIEFEVLNS